MLGYIQPLLRGISETAVGRVWLDSSGDGIGLLARLIRAGRFDHYDGMVNRQAWPQDRGDGLRVLFGDMLCAYVRGEYDLAVPVELWVGGSRGLERPQYPHNGYDSQVVCQEAGTHNRYCPGGPWDRRAHFSTIYRVAHPVLWVALRLYDPRPHHPRIMSGLFLRRDPRDMGQVPDGASGGMEPVTKRETQASGLSLREAMRTRHFWMMAGIYSSFGFCRATFIAHIAAHVQDLGFSLTNGANVLAVLTGSSIIGRIGMGRVADMIGNRAAFMVSFAVTTIILTHGLVAQGLWELYLFGIVFGFAWGAQAVLRFAITSEVFGLVSLGLVMGVLGFAEYGTAAFGAYVAGYVFDVVRTYRPVFLMGMGVSGMGIIFAWLLKPAMRKDVGVNVPSQ